MKGVEFLNLNGFPVGGETKKAETFDVHKRKYYRNHQDKYS